MIKHLQFFKKGFLLLFFSFLLWNSNTNAATLAAGDLAVVGWSALTDKVNIVTLASIPSGTVIKITDRGWDQSTDAFTTGTTGDGTVTWTTTSTVTAGTVLELYFGGSDATTTLTNITTNTSLTSEISVTTYTVADPMLISGDQIFIYQDTDTNPFFIFGMNNSAGTVDGNNWNTSIAILLRDSMLPDGTNSQNSLTNGTNAIGIAGGASQQDNIQYTGPTTSANKATWLSRLVNSTNWTGDNTGSTTNVIGTSSGSVVNIASLAAPTVTTASASSVLSTSVMLGGNVTADGGATVSERGIVYATTTNPTTSNTRVQIGSGTGTFSQSVTGLSSGTTYYVRAYAINSQATSYGSQVTFTTLSTNANLSSLALNSGTLSPTFASGTTSYTASVSNATNSITVTPTVSDATATVTVNGITVTSGSASGSIALSVGSNTITTVVTAQDGSTTKTYTVTVTRAASTNANLSSLALSSGTLTPTFASGTTSYTTSVSNATSSITVTPTVSDATATVTVNGTTVTSGSASGSIALSVGSNTITTVVTAQDGSTTKTYTVTVTRAASTNANLASLSLSSGTLSPTFASGTTSYTASVSNATSSITVTPTVSDATATVTVNGTTVTSGSASGSTALSVGSNTITTVVTAQDGSTTKTYTVTVTRAASTNANLASLSLSSGTLSPTFASGTTSYTASVSNATSSITVTPTVSDATATVTVNGTAVTSGSTSGSIALSVGSNTITTVVTAQDGITTQTYTVTVTRDAPATTSVSSIVRASTNPSNASSVNYTVTFAASVTGVDATDFTLTTTGVSGASVGTPTGSGTSWTVPVNTGTGSGTIRLDFTGTTGVTPNVSASYTSGEVYTIDRTGPTVSSVASTSLNGVYTIGNTIGISVTFSEAATVAGTPQLTLETGTTDRVADYVSGSGTTTLLFNYTVQAGDTNSDLDYISTSALSLNGGTIKDAVGNNAVLTLPTPGAANSLSANSNININTTPVVSTSGTLSAFTTCSGTASSSQSFTVSGGNLGANLVVTAPTGFEVSTTSGSGYGSTVSLAPSSNSVANTTIYVRLTSSASGSPSGNIAVTSTGATTKNVAASGTVNALPVVAAISGGSSVAVGQTLQLSNSTGGGTWSSSNTSAATIDASGLVTGVAMGSTTITYTVTTSGCSTSVTKNVEVLGVGSLASITLSAGTLTPAFSSSTTNYTASVSNSTSSITVSASALHGTAYVNGTANSANIPLNVGTNTINVTVSYNSGYTGTSSYTIVVTRDAPATTTVSSIARANASPTNATSVSYTVTFAASVTGVDAGDFTLTSTSTANGTIGTPTGSGPTWTVPVNSVSGNGTLRLDFTGTTGVTPNVSSSYTSGEIYTIDNTLPAVTSVTVPANGTYKTGDNLNFTVNFDENVTVTGSPYLAVTLNTGGAVNATYQSGSGTSALVFGYTVASGNADADGITVASAITANGGTLKDAVGNNATLTLNSVGSTALVKVDGIAPTLSSVTIASNNATASLAKIGDVITLNLTASENISTPTVTIAGQTASVSGSGSSYAATYTMAGSNTEGVVQFSVSFSDLAGNNGTAVTATSNSSSVTFDKTAPAIPAGLAATSGDTENVINWTSNSEGDLKSYKVFGGTSANPTTLLSSITAGTITYTHTGLTNGTTYYYRIASTDNAGNESAYSTDVTAVPRASQTITFNPLSAVTYGDADFDAGATASSGLAVSYTSDNTSVASIVAGKIHIVGQGTANITASQAGNSAYLAAGPVSRSLTVNKKELTLTLNSTPAITKVYDGNTTASLVDANYTLTGKVGADVVTVSGTASYDTKSVGSNKTITVNNFVLAGANKDNYTLGTTSLTTTGAITAKALTASVQPVSKEYDGNATASITFNALNAAAGLVGSDNVSVVYTSASYENKNIGSGKTVTITGAALSGTDKDNYTLNAFTSTTGAITAKSLTATVQPVTKEYDGNTTATITFNPLTGFVSGETVGVTYTSASYDNKNVGTNKTVTVTGATLSGADKDNYTLNAFTSTTGTITAKALTASSQPVTKVYDGNTNATITFNALNAAAGLVGSDNVSVVYTSATYDNKNVGTGKTVTVTGAALSGTDKDNYTLNAFTSTTGAITAKVLTASVQPVSKEYDGNTTASITFNALNAAAGLVGSDNVSVVYTSASYDNKNIGAGKTVTITGAALSGTDKDNYTLNAFTSTTGAITAKALTASVQPITKEYDGSTTATITFNPLTGFVSGETVGVTYTSASYDTKNVGTGKTVAVTGAALSGADKDNYTLNAFTSTTGAITAKALTASAQPVTKVYDGNATATLSFNALNAGAGLVGSDNVSVVYTSASYDNKNVGTGKTVTVTGAALSGTDKDNYTLNAFTSTTGAITAKALTASAQPVSKEYDGNANATITFNAFNAAAGLVGSDNVSVVYTSASYDNKNIGSGKTVTITGAALSGTDKDNYTLNAFTSTTGAITAKSLTASVQPVTKEYDGNTTATITFNPLTGFVSGETVGVTYTSASYDNKNVGTNKTVTVTGATLNGADKDNYTLNAFTSTTGTITAKALTASAQPVTKVYDGNTSATITFNALNAAAGLVGSDNVSVVYTSASYDNKNAGTGKTVTVTGAALSGTDKDNYTLNAFTSTTGTITAKALTASVQPVSKEYDGNTNANITFNALNAAAGLVGSDNVSVVYTSASYDNKNIGSGKTVTITGAALSGTDKDNYTLNAFTSTTGAITAKALTASAQPITKEYDGNTTATIIFNPLTGFVSGETVGVTYTSASYDNKNVGTNKTVTITGAALNGADKDNYTLNAFTSTTGAITAKALTASAQPVTKVYDGNATATLSFNALNAGAGLVGSDNVSVTYTSASYDNKNAGTGKTVTVTGAALSGTDKDNYTLNAFTSTTGTITAKALTASVQPVSKEYDGNTTASISFNALNAAAGLVGSDNVSVVYTSASYDTKNIGSGKTVTITGAALSGTDKDNYTLNAITSTTGAITAKALTASVQPVTKVYDGNTTATIIFNPLTGFVSGETVGVTYTSASYDNKNVGTNKTITITGATLSGADKDNYTLNAFTSTTGAITSKAVTASLISTVSKVYDGNITVSNLTSANYDLSGKVNSDDVSLNNPTSGTYDNEDVGTGKTVTVTGLALIGADKNNYSLASNAISGAIGSITTKTITVSLTGTISKEYDGNATASNLTAANYSISGKVGSDDVNINNPTSGTYDNKNIGTGKAVTVAGLVLTGSDKDNYTLASTSISGAIGSITSKIITASLTGSVSKVYDGLTTAALSASNYSFTGKVNSDDVSLNNPTSGTYDNKNVGTGKTVAVTGLALTGADKDNYTLASTSLNGTVGVITAKPVTLALNATPAITKVYDGTTLATLAAGNYTLTGVEIGDVVTVSGTANYDDKNVGTGKTITVNTFVLSGAQKDNYSLTTPSATTTGSITAKSITLALNATPAITKVYDGTTSATLVAGNYTLTGVEAGDVVTVSGTANYDNKNVGTGKTITVNSFVLAGAEKGNYSLNTTSASTTGDITAKSITLALNATPVISKVYDGTTLVSLVAGNYTLTGVEIGDVVSVSGTANYDNKNVGTGKIITVNSFVLAGAQKDNYSLATPSATTTGSITAKSITLALNATPAIAKVYDGNTSATLATGNYSFSGVVSGDILSVSGTAVYDNKNVGIGKAITANAFALAGADKDNYNLTTTSAGTTGSVTAKALTITAENKEKFQGLPLPVFTASYSGFIAGESSAVLTTQPSFSTTATANSPQGTYPITVSGATASNYSITFVNGVLTVKPGYPTGLSLGATTLYENAPAGTIAGTLSSTSDDPTTTFAYSLVSGSGDTDNAKFSIVNNELRTSAPLNFEDKASYSVRIRTTAQNSLLTLDKEFSITLNNVNEQPTMNDISAQTICYSSTQQTVALSGISAGPDANQTTTVSVSSTNNALFKSLTVTQANGGNAQVRYTITDGAFGSAVVNVMVMDNGGVANGGVNTILKSFVLNVNPLPVASITANKSTTISKGDVLVLTATGGTSYQWDNANGILSGQNNHNLTVRPSETTTYRVLVSNANNCQSWAEITVEVLSDYQLVKGTNILTPNGDGVNDYLEIRNLDLYPNNVVKIFDRAGRLLYSKANYNAEWNGTFNGSPLAEDTYYYIVDFGGNKPKIKGFVTIVRD